MLQELGPLIRLLLHHTVVPCQHHVLVFASEICTLKTQGICQGLLDVIRHLVAGLTTGETGELQGQLVQEVDLVSGSGIHEEKERV